MSYFRLILAATRDAVEAIAGLLLILALLPWIVAMCAAIERDEYPL